MCGSVPGADEKEDDSDGIVNMKSVKVPGDKQSVLDPVSSSGHDPAKLNQLVSKVSSCCSSEDGGTRMSVIKPISVWPMITGEVSVPNWEICSSLVRLSGDIGAA
jgi:hypothetical protein